MALATLLSIHGYSARLEKVKDRMVAIWILDEDDVDEFVVELVGEYRRGEARVEPRKFIHELKLVRKAAYDIIGHKPLRVPSASEVVG